jgi:predicted dinucleotide-binding enzyme
MQVTIIGAGNMGRALATRLVAGGHAVEIIDRGLRAIDVGLLHGARQLEQLGLLHITLQETLGTGFGSAVKLHW